MIKNKKYKKKALNAFKKDLPNIKVQLATCKSGPVTLIPEDGIMKYYTRNINAAMSGKQKRSNIYIKGQNSDIIEDLQSYYEYLSDR